MIDEEDPLQEKEHVRALLLKKGVGLLLDNDRFFILFPDRSRLAFEYFEDFIYYLESLPDVDERPPGFYPAKG